MKEGKALIAREGMREGLLGGGQLSRIEALRAGREPIGMWPLMVWAYKAEMVRFTCGTDFRAALGSSSSMAWAMRAAMSGIVGGADGGSSLPACCHDDALLVHGAVLRVIAAERNKGSEEGARAVELLIKHAEVGRAPIWEVPEPVWTVRPVLRARGKVKHLYAARNEAIACEVECVGVIAALGVVVGSAASYLALRSDARARYVLWWQLLEEAALALAAEHAKLKRWRLVGIGAEKEPWKGGAA